MILLASIKHTGTNYMFSVLGGERTRLTKDGKIDNIRADILWSHFDTRTPHVMELSGTMKTIIPLRHPMLIAISWKKRGKVGWLSEWMRMCAVQNAFYFPMHSKPFYDLAQYTGLELNRHDKVLNSFGECPERKNLKTACNFLQYDLGDVIDALETPVGRRFYDSDLRWL